ncbi:hypothetical protein BDW22DRAFT_1344338 [Trametopsis cervina]|nr:hypothetical protein BDW22DRAFT_1344338 [Trametopsis cervina]
MTQPRMLPLARQNVSVHAGARCSQVVRPKHKSNAPVFLRTKPLWFIPTPKPENARILGKACTERGSSIYTTRAHRLRQIIDTGCLFKPPCARCTLHTARCAPPATAITGVDFRLGQHGRREIRMCGLGMLGRAMSAPQAEVAYNERQECLASCSGLPEPYFPSSVHAHCTTNTDRASMRARHRASSPSRFEHIVIQYCASKTLFDAHQRWAASAAIVSRLCPAIAIAMSDRDEERRGARHVNLGEREDMSGNGARRWLSSGPPSPSKSVGNVIPHPRLQNENPAGGLLRYVEAGQHGGDESTNARRSGLARDVWVWSEKEEEEENNIANLFLVPSMCAALPSTNIAASSNLRTAARSPGKSHFTVFWSSPALRKSVREREAKALPTLRRTRREAFQEAVIRLG